MNVAKDARWEPEDPLFKEAKLALPDEEKRPISFLQRRYRLGYSRALQLYEEIKNAPQIIPPHVESINDES